MIYLDLPILYLVIILGKKSRKTSNTWYIHRVGPSGGQLIGLLVGGMVIGGAVVYFLPKVAPQVYTQLDKASGGFLTNLNNGIHYGLRTFGLEK